MSLISKSARVLANLWLANCYFVATKRACNIVTRVSTAAVMEPDEVFGRDRHAG
jgi:hypothetical protein